MSKFSKSKTVVLKQKLQIILIIQHYCVELEKVLQYVKTKFHDACFGFMCKTMATEQKVWIQT